MTHIEQTIYGTVTKKNLLWKANMVKRDLINYVLCYCIFVLKRIKK